MSSPTTTPRRTPKRTTPRTTPKRTPLSEHSSSQKNEAAGRLPKNSKQELTDAEIFTTTPFPTKPQHVLLPSTIRKQRSRRNIENELPALFHNRSQPEIPTHAAALQVGKDERGNRRAPNLQLKRSVTALRDMYEAQAESSRPSNAVHSRPSTAAPSPAIRPTTANSRLRSISSSEGLPGRGAWEMLGLPKVSMDDLAMLPTLSENIAQLNSEHSFASRMGYQAETSSPNFRTFGTSSPQMPTFHDVVTSSGPTEGSSSTGKQMASSSSPNIVQLHHDLTFMTTDPISPTLDEERESSPNIVKLGTTSPRRSSSPTRSNASTTSRKRKRSDVEASAFAGRTPLFFARGSGVQSSPTLQNPLITSDTSLQSSESRIVASSPPEVESGRPDSQSAPSPVFRLPTGRFSTDRSSLVSAHTNLQSVLSSSPGPPVHRPIVRAPDVNQFEILAMQKRAASGQSTVGAEMVPRLSPVSSVTNVEVQQFSSTNLDTYHASRSASRTSIFTEDLDENLDAESIAPIQAYMMQYDLNSSQVNMISDVDRHEAADELSALPRQHSSFAAALSQARSASFLDSSSSNNSLSRLDSVRTSIDSRLQHMRSFTHTRNDSYRSYCRPGSSGSYVSANVVPTWARRYYSGFYQNSFQYLYGSSNNLSYTVTQVQPPTQRSSMPPSIKPSSSHETMTIRSHSRRSLTQSLRSSVRKFMPSMIISTGRPRLDVRESHMTAGLGPLVSNPVRPRSEMLSRPPSVYEARNTIRRVSAPLTAFDPRYHWNGIIEEPESAEEAAKIGDNEYTGTPRHIGTPVSSPPPQVTHQFFPRTHRLSRLPTPHLHQDRRLHTGSSASRGFGAPYNIKPKWQPPNEFIDELSRLSWFRLDLRDAQVVCFIAGFIVPPSWFVGALLPLPRRPSSYHDLGKSEIRQPHWHSTHEPPCS